ncbi:MAG: hypothetical protein ACRC1H_03655, partial [Caldilineaceae bacterium]
MVVAPKHSPQRPVDPLVTDAMPTTAQMLTGYDAELLEAIAEQRSATDVQGTRAQVVNSLAADLTSPSSVRAAYEDALDTNALAEEAIETLLTAGGEMAEAKFSKQYGSIRQMGSARMRREAPWLNPESVAEVLYYLGLMGHRFVGAGQSAHSAVYLPSDVVPWLPRKQAETDPEGLLVQAVPPPPRPRTVVADDSFLDDAGALLGFLTSDSLRLEAGGPNAEDIDRLVLRLQLPFDDTMPEQGVRLALLLHLANRL